jgi:hypothetical protein
VLHPPGSWYLPVGVNVCRVLCAEGGGRQAAQAGHVHAGLGHAGPGCQDGLPIWVVHHPPTQALQRNFTCAGGGRGHTCSTQGTHVHTRNHAHKCAHKCAGGQTQPGRVGGALANSNLAPPPRHLPPHNSLLGRTCTCPCGHIYHTTDRKPGKA